MTSLNSKPTFSLIGQMLRLPEEITRVLNSLLMRREPLFSELDGGRLLFCSRLLFIDPARTYIVVELSTNAAANKALLARPRVTFHAEPGGWRVEFAAADPKPSSAHEAFPGIRLRFPEVIVGHRRREQERTKAAPQQGLRCVIDEEGVTPFDGIMTDVSKSGIGFLQYDPTISLEPGTVLKGCRIDSRSGDSIVLDMEVRYSTLLTLADGTQVRSSGCRFVNFSAEDAARIEKLFGLK